jgi:formate dehydrogenase subunit gamma
MAKLLQDPPELNSPTPGKSKQQEFIRFSGMLIAEHWAVMVLFFLLVITGIPQRYSEAAWSQLLVRYLGGIDIARGIHRLSGILFAALAAWHLARVLYGVLVRNRSPYMIPTSKDFRDAIGTLRYYLRLSENFPKFDRYDFRQKFEYFGLLMGGMVMIATGFLLFAPVFFTKFLPAFLIPVAKTAHGYEAMLALSVILIWHLYGAHLSPDVFPLDKSIFTGKISRERMETEHPLELERIEYGESLAEKVKESVADKEIEV